MPAVLRQLLPPGAAVTALQIVEALGLPAPPTAGSLRPRLLLNMVSTVDGRATIGGRSGAIGDRADRELFHALRTVVDAVMVGAGTARTERYGGLVREPSERRLRREHGLAEEPLACIVSGRLQLGDDMPLLRDPQARIVILTPSPAMILTPSPASLAGGAQIAAHLDYIRAEREGRLDLPRALAELGERFAVRTVLCEGGPHLNAQLLAAGVVDELFLSLAPKLAGGEPDGKALRILAGVDLDPPIELELLSVLESQSYLFLRYAVRHAG